MLPNYRIWGSEVRILPGAPVISMAQQILVLPLTFLVTHLSRCALSRPAKSATLGLCKNKSASPPRLPRLIGYGEIEEAFGLSRRQLERMQRDGRFPRAIDITGAGGNRRAWPLQVVLDWYEERKGCAIGFVTQPDELKREQVEDAAVELSARHMSNILGEKVSADDVVIGSVKQLSPADAETVGYTRWLALWLAIEGQMTRLTTYRHCLSFMAYSLPCVRPSKRKPSRVENIFAHPVCDRLIWLSALWLAPSGRRLETWAQDHNKRASST